jgi:hypothetical protein
MAWLSRPNQLLVDIGCALRLADDVLEVNSGYCHHRILGRLGVKFQRQFPQNLS